MGITAVLNREDERQFDAGFVAAEFAASPDPAEARRLLATIRAAAINPDPITARQPLVLYGAGNLGRLARAHLSKLGIPVTAAVDTNAAKIGRGPDWFGVPVLTPDEVSADLKARAMLAVAVVNSPFVPLANALVEEGWGEVVPFYDIAEAYRVRHPLSNGWFAGQMRDEDFDGIATAMTGWSDARSRAHHLQFAAWRYARQEWRFGDATVDPAERFWIPEVLAALDGDDAFLDAGAYDGSVTEKFAALTNSDFRHVWAIEPDGASRSRLEETVARMSPETRRRVDVLPHVLGQGSCEVFFHDGLGYASQIADSGIRRRPIAEIDSLSINPDIIKLHLEGGELDALKGALRTIRTHRPVVMATTYHNADGLWKTPLWLMRELSGYKFYMRMHGWCGTGAVVYAIPVERGLA